MLFVSDLKWIVMLSTFYVQSTWQGIFEPSASHFRTLSKVFTSIVRGGCRALDAVVSFRRKKLLATYLLMNR